MVLTFEYLTFYKVDYNIVTGEMVAKTLVGKVSHYFGNLGVAALTLSGDLKNSDKLRFERTDGTLVLESAISSMQINREDVDSAGPGDDVAVKVDGRVHEGNVIYKVTEEE